VGLEIVPLVLAALAVAFVMWGVQARRGAGDLPDHWRRVSGTVVDASRPQRVMYVTPDGRRVQVRGTLDPTYEVGQDVEVLVDPVDPTRARLVEADRAAARVGRTMLVLGAVFAVAAALALFTFG
jgi:hypothetical protein